LAGAGVNQAAGRIRPAGRQLGIAVLEQQREDSIHLPFNYLSIKKLSNKYTGEMNFRQVKIPS
jgi:hypothetical protein